MVIGIIGENCSGKSTLASVLSKRIKAEIITGKDYLRLAKTESEATALFREKLARAVNGDSILYVISDPEHLSLLPDGAKRIYVKADLETIKERFRARMHGKLPPPVEAMLERRHGLFDGEQFDMIYDGANDSPEAFCSGLFPDGPNYGG